MRRAQRAVLALVLLLSWSSCADDDASDTAMNTAPSSRDAGRDAGRATDRDASSNADAGRRTPREGAWPMMGFDRANTYFNPAETVLSTANAESLVERWRFTALGFPPGSPAIAEGKVFVMASGATHALDLETGEEVWRRDDVRGSASLAYADGFVYAHTLLADVYKLRAEDGSTVWGPVRSYELEGCEGVSSPILAAGMVIVGHSCGALEARGTPGQAMARGGVEAFDAETGERVWTYYTVPESGENGAMVWSSVAIDAEGGTVFATTGNNYTVAGENSDAFHAIDLGDGTRRWKTQVREGDLWSVPMFIGGPDTDFGANPILAEVAGTEVVAAGDKASAFWMLDRATGEILWQREDLSTNHTPANGGVLMNGAFDGTRFYVVSNQPPQASVLHALDAETGEDVWTESFGATAWGAPSVANGLLFVPIDATLYVLDAQRGEMLTSFDTGGTIAAGAAAIAGGRVVVQSGLQYVWDRTTKNNNQIICYGLPDD
jgi:polyvinyl alcohol dehydrogenase (cytochrome)